MRSRARSTLLSSAFGLLLLVASLPAYAVVSPQPGDTCTAGQTGYFTTNAGSLQQPGFFLVCDGSHWNLFQSFTTAGNVGIGSTSPAAALDIGTGQMTGGSKSATYRDYLDMASGGTNFPAADFIFPSNGIFRIGQQGVVGTNDIIVQPNPQTTSGYGYFETWNGAGTMIGTGNSTPIIFRPNRSEAMRIAASGNVGIGTTSPNAGTILDLGTATNAMLLPSGTSAQRPTAANGMLRYNSTVPQVEAYYSGAWNALEGGAAPPTPYYNVGSNYYLGPLVQATPPVSGNYSWNNQGTASVSVGTNGDIFMTTPTGAGDNWRIQEMAAPGTPYTITAAFIPALLASYQACGLVFHETSSGKLIGSYSASRNAGNNPMAIDTEKWTNVTTWSATVGEIWPIPSPTVVWLRMKDDGTYLYFYYSADGSNYIQLYKDFRNSFFSSAPDRIGWMIDAHSSTVNANCTLVSWLQT